jgi:hypothetical protein
LELGNQIMADLLENPEIISIIVDYIRQYQDCAREISESSKSTIFDSVWDNQFRMDSIYNSIFDSNKILQKEVPTADEVKEHIEAIKAN